VFDFRVEATRGRARAGVLTTPHGTIKTPVFMPVGTQGAVKALAPDQVWETGAGIVLANAFHCMLRPGADLIERAGGLHAFMRWPGSILTDSGGFQVFSLAKIRQIKEEGVTFQSPIDGSRHFMSPEVSIAIQNQLGADIIMAFDECVRLPASADEVRVSVDRTSRWAERCLDAHRRPDEQALFGIVQGGTDPELRARSAEAITALPFPGFAIGGLSVGESREDMVATLDVTTPLVPADKPRYLMGVGTPDDLRAAINAGIDMFDCVYATRAARHGTLWSQGEKIHIRSPLFREDPLPIDPDCDCHTCQRYDRRYLHHICRAGEYLSHTLLSIHNIRALVRLCERIREEIVTAAPQLSPAT
jgi:queuine tRNA-ribosyltransferase